MLFQKSIWNKILFFVPISGRTMKNYRQRRQSKYVEMSGNITVSDIDPLLHY